MSRTPATATPLTSPPAARRDDVVDVLHGTPVADPYRWLEDGDDAEVAAWVAAQNEHTRAALDVPSRAVWHDRLVALMQLPVLQQASLRDDRLFCYERPAGAEQFVLTRRSAIDAAAPPVTLLDPAGAAADAAVAIDWFEPSSDGAIVAVGTSEGGDELSTLRLIDGATGAPLDGDGDGDAPDVIPNTRACSVAWEPDGSGFFYTRYPDGDEYHRTVHHHHRLGDDWRDDPVVWGPHADPRAWPWVTLSRDGRWLAVAVYLGSGNQNDLHVLDRTTDTWTTVIEGVDAHLDVSFSADLTALVGVTDLDAPRGRVVRITLDALGAGPDAWETLVPEHDDDVIAGLAVTAAGMVMVTTRAAVDTIHLLDADGRPRPDAAVSGLDGAVSVAAIASSSTADDAFVVVDSYTAPTAAWRLAADGTVTRWDTAADATALTGELTVRRIEYPSRDGTPVGLFLVHRADVTPSPDTPAILWGYGGFTISESPQWRPEIGAWCAAGGVYARAGLRGGVEHGEHWHKAGMREHKQNVFDDFAAAGDHLVESGLASRDRLAVHGRSNGGLLVGATITQRPDLCKAALCGVPLLDMVRFPEFLIAKLWTPEYGDPQVAEEFAWLHAYSPYHHVTEGTCYPATLIQTAEGDTRVDPMHARKMAALLQWASPCQEERPILLSQEGRAGHGVGKPVSKRADELADALTFVGTQLGLT